MRRVKEVAYISSCIIGCVQKIERIMSISGLCYVTSASNNKESVVRTLIITQSPFVVEALLICITCFAFTVAIDSAGLHEGMYRRFSNPKLWLCGVAICKKIWIGL